MYPTVKMIYIRQNTKKLKMGVIGHGVIYTVKTEIGYCERHGDLERRKLELEVQMEKRAI